VFIKRSWNPRLKHPKVHKQLAESYWDPQTKRSRHRTLVNITEWPEKVVQALELALQGKRLVDAEGLSYQCKDPYRGGGILTIAWLWKKLGMEGVLHTLSPATRQSIFLMVAQRILEPGSTLSLQRSLADTLFARVWSANRFDEDSLYQAMDELEEAFYTTQAALRAQHRPAPRLLLYDITSTYFEGSEAEEAAYGYSRDKRWDRYQIVIGLVCDAAGIPLAVEVWPGDTADTSTVAEQISLLKERFGIEEAVVVGDKGMYSAGNLEAISDLGFSFILGLDWREQRKQLLSVPPANWSFSTRWGWWSGRKGVPATWAVLHPSGPGGRKHAEDRPWRRSKRSWGSSRIPAARGPTTASSACTPKWPRFWNTTG